MLKEVNRSEDKNFSRKLFDLNVDQEVKRTDGKMIPNLQKCSSVSLQNLKENHSRLNVVCIKVVKVM